MPVINPFIPSPSQSQAIAEHHASGAFKPPAATRTALDNALSERHHAVQQLAAFEAECRFITSHGRHLSDESLARLQAYRNRLAKAEATLTHLLSL